MFSGSVNCQVADKHKSFEWGNQELEVYVNTLAESEKFPKIADNNGHWVPS